QALGGPRFRRNFDRTDRRSPGGSASASAPRNADSASNSSTLGTCTSRGQLIYSGCYLKSFNPNEAFSQSVSLQSALLLLHTFSGKQVSRTRPMATASPSVVNPALKPPPGPKGHFLLGNLAAVSRDWLGFYVQCARDYGDVVQLRYVHVPICLLMHPRDIEYVLVTNPGNFTKSADYRALARVLGNGLLTNEGKPWQRQRSLIQPAF